MGDGDYIEQEMRDVFCCWLKRPPLHIFKENNENVGNREGAMGMI